MKKILVTCLLLLFSFTTLDAYCSKNITCDTSLNLTYTPIVKEEVIVTTEVKGTNNDFNSTLTYDTIPGLIMLYADDLKLNDIDYLYGDSTVEIIIRVTNNLKSSLYLTTTAISIGNLNFTCYTRGDWLDTIEYEPILLHETLELTCYLDLYEYSDSSSLSIDYMLFF